MSKIIFDFTDENFIVTGASSGMGKQIALDLATAGANILAIARNNERLAELKNKYPERITVCTMDMENLYDAQSVIEDFVSQCGKINGMVHSAGFVELTTIRTVNIESAMRMMNVSFWSGLKLLKILTKKKYSADGASFVIFSSVSAIRPEAGNMVYSSVKAAICAMVHAMAKEISLRKQRINTICPGLVDTPMTAPEINRTTENKHLLGIGAVEDVSGAVQFLLSDNARWITGTDLIIDGGYLAN